MSIKKSSLLSIFIYVIVFFSPFLFTFISKDALVLGTTIIYITGCCLLIFLYYKGKEPALIEQNAKLDSPVFTFLLGFSGIFLALIVQAIVFAIEAAITGKQPSSENTQDIIAVILKSPFFILATTIAGPIMEEFVFRRSFIGLLQPYTGFWLGASISSAVFSIAHQDGHFFVYFFMGIFFSILYKATGKIWTSIIAHCGMNSLVVLAQLAIHYGWIVAPKS